MRAAALPPPRGGVGGEGQFCCEWPGVGSLAAGGVSSRTPISRNSPQPVCFGASLEPGRLCAGAPRGRPGPRPGAQACVETLGRPCLLENGRLHPPRGPHATPGTRGSAHAAGPSTLVPPGVLTPLSARRREARLRTAHSRAWPAPPPAGPPLRPVQPQPGPSRPPPPGPPLRSPKPGPPAPGLHTGPAHRPRTPAPLLCRALFPDIYLAGPLAEARSRLKRHLPAASLRLPTCKRSMASTPGP